MSLPSGTVTWWFTDVEDSTRRWADDESGMRALMAQHDEIMHDVLALHGGVLIKHNGDGIDAVFTSASNAVAAAVDAQERLDEIGLPVRMGLHTGDAELRERDYFGSAVNLTARIMDAGHGGQILLSQATAGLVPGGEAIDLGEHSLKGFADPQRIFQVGSSGFPPLRVVAVRRGNLPSEPTSFVGRHDELQHVVDELVDHRLVTLFGVGGTGKTRLAIEVAHAIAPTFPDGCWFVELAPVRDDDGVPVTVVTGAGLAVPMVGDVVDHLVEQLRHQRRLIVVDNCEHVLATAADVIERIIDQCPAVSVLATSREPLNLRAERLCAVPSLNPTDAMRLFHERAEAESVDVVGDTVQERAIEEICRRLDGVPLAIELAAARVRAFTPVELAGMLDQRFRVLVGGKRSRLERHQTLRGALDWSYDLCTEDETLVLDRLAVFPGQFDLAGARFVAGDERVDDVGVVDAVSALVDRSLVVRTIGADGTTRYSLLETVRAYGREHLTERDELAVLRDRHAAMVEDAVRRHFPAIIGPDEVEQGRRLTEYVPDAAVALEWLIERERWASAEWVAWVGGYDAERFFWDAYARILAAMNDRGVAGRDADRVRVMRMSMDGGPSREAEQAAYWEWLRRDPVDDEPPNLCAIGAEPRSQDEVDELIRLIDRRRDHELTIVHLWRRWHLLRHLAMAGFEVPLGEVDRFESEMRALGSADGMCAVREVRGQIAIREHDWVAAAGHFGAIIDQYRDRSMWLRHVSTWNWVSTRALAGRPVSPDELRRSWTWLRESGFNVLEPRAAAATAVSLASSANDELAQRFLAWLQSHCDISALGGIAEELEAAGLSLAHPLGDEPDLDALVAALASLHDGGVTRRA